MSVGVFFLCVLAVSIVPAIVLYVYLVSNTSVEYNLNHYQRNATQLLLLFNLSSFSPVAVLLSCTTDQLFQICFRSFCLLCAVLYK
jgi:hypothetical protein